MQFAARYNIKPWTIYNPNSGGTNNVAECLNVVIKRLLEWTELLVHCVCLSLHYLQSFYFAEIQKGMIGVGEYKLKNEFKASQQTPNEVKILKAYAPEEIVDAAKSKINDSIQVMDITGRKSESAFAYTPD